MNNKYVNIYLKSENSDIINSKTKNLITGVVDSVRCTIFHDFCTKAHYLSNS
jgi:hypothetical protein